MNLTTTISATRSDSTNDAQALVGAVRSVLIRVADLNEAKAFYVDGLGLVCTGETDAVSDDVRRVWGIGDGAVRVARVANPADQFGMIELVEWSGGINNPMRGAMTARDGGLFSLNFKTGNIERALTHLERFGANPVSAPLSYEAGRPIREVMVNLATGERLTILQVGATVDDENLHPLGGAIATVGMIVPALEGALRFWRDALGLSVALSIDHTGEPFTTMLGVHAATRMEMSLLTSGGEWTGKFELIQLTAPDDSCLANISRAHSGARRNDYWMISVTAADLDAVAAGCRRAGANLLSEPVTVDRPFVGRTRVMTVDAPGGVNLEVLEVLST